MLSTVKREIFARNMETLKKDITRYVAMCNHKFISIIKKLITILN